MTQAAPALLQLAQAYGVLTEYYDLRGRRQEATTRAMLTALRTLGADVVSAEGAPIALLERKRAIGKRVIEPVIVCWEGQPASWVLRQPEAPKAGAVLCTLTTEQGTVQEWKVDLEALPVTQAIDVARNDRYLVRQAPLPAGLPLGYHTLTVEGAGLGSAPLSAKVICAPNKAYQPLAGKRWGIFMPLYALHSRRSVAVGDLTDLERLTAWTEARGGSFVATLPLLASFLDKPLEPSPYVPVSRLFWNELYVDAGKALHGLYCLDAHQALASEEFREQATSLGDGDYIDYPGAMALKRGVLERASQCFFEHGDRHLMQEFVTEHPEAEAYGQFRAAVERHGSPWRSWPEALRNRGLKPDDFDPDAARYHLFVQWAADQQMRDLSDQARGDGRGLYLDLPVGVHPDGFDTWRYRSAFVEGVSTGAPPDDFFTQGQDWGFPPLHPEHIREDGYEYFIKYIRHHLRSAAILRIDHVMAFHRLFWVPQGAKANDGVYVRYSPEEFYAILCLESHRNRAEIIGENLGTVPPEVTATLERHAMTGMHVAQFRIQPSSAEPVTQPPANVAASINTHDVPPFAAFWRGLDIDWRGERGLLDARGMEEERQRREAVKAALAEKLTKEGLLSKASVSEGEVLQAWLAYLSSGPARIMVVSLEDFWGETRPQNIPGTGAELPNWRRRARLSLEQFSVVPEILNTLMTIDNLRRNERSANAP